MGEAGDSRKKDGKKNPERDGVFRRSPIGGQQRRIPAADAADEKRKQGSGQQGHDPELEARGPIRSLPGKDKKLVKKEVPTIFAEVNDDLYARVKNKEFPDRSLGFKWVRENKDSEPAPVITHLALFKEGHIPEIQFAEEFEYEEDDIQVYNEKFEDAPKDFEVETEDDNRKPNQFISHNMLKYLAIIYWIVIIFNS